jgi:hypothetical protein
MTGIALICRQRNLAMMNAPHRWPLYPFLPLRRVRSEASEPALGMLYDAWGTSGTPGHSATVFFGNVCSVPATEEALFTQPREVFDTFAEVYDAGWRVD